MTTAAVPVGWPAAACRRGCGVFLLMSAPATSAPGHVLTDRPGALDLRWGTHSIPRGRGADVPRGFRNLLSPTPLALKSAPTPLKSTSRKA